MRNRKRYRKGPNDAEHKFELSLADKGIDFSRRGYPDYILLRDGEIYGFIEVKPRKDKPLKSHQELFGIFCKRYNIPFARWSPEEEFPEWF